jgi:hypothetical protein
MSGDVVVLVAVLAEAATVINTYLTAAPSPDELVKLEDTPC